MASVSLDTVYADHPEVTVEVAAGSGLPECSETQECFLPSTATVDVGEKVIFSNTDTLAHTFTSGTVNDGTDGVFNSELILSGDSFEWTPEKVGKQPYYCLVHPWMQGVIIVQKADTTGDGDKITNDDKTINDDKVPKDTTLTPTYGKTQTVSTHKGTLDVRLTYDVAESYAESRINIDFLNPRTQEVQENIDYTVSVSKEGQTVFGPTLLTHTSAGSVQIPTEFILEQGVYTINLGIEGILFQKIPIDTASFDILVDTDSVHPVMPAEIEEETEIEEPSPVQDESTAWFKDAALQYGQDQISDTEFFGMIQFLIDRNIVTIPSDNRILQLEEKIRDLQNQISTLQSKINSDISVPEPNENKPDTKPPIKDGTNNDDFSLLIMSAIGSGVSGCEETQECYLPSTATVNIGSTVLFSNIDTVAHTFTSGTKDGGTDGAFDSGLILSGGSFKWTPEKAGVQPYFCIVHPWKEGQIIVNG